MALNPEFVGRTYPPTGTYLVGREKIREFADAIGDDNPAFHDPQAARDLGYADVIAPPTFAFAITMKAFEGIVLDPELGLDYTRVVHGEQSFAYHRPITAGDELQVTMVIEGIRAVAGNDMITAKATLSTVAGEPVATSTSLIVARGTDAP